MYKKSAGFYDALYHFKNYKEASEKLRDIIYRFNPKAKTLLDTACGTGKHIEYLNKYFDPEGLDINEDLLNIAKQRCPGTVFHFESMIDFDLRKKYDVVTCLFSSIAYVKTPGNLFNAVKCMSAHLNPGGLLIIEPWFSRETFWTDRITVNHYDEKDLKITWMYTPKIENDLSVLEINYLVGTPSEVSYFKERHELGLFDDTQYRSSMEKPGLKIEYDKEGLFGRGMYIGIKN
ncbi:MAG: class I SAM-dependent methyltransferase [Ignavibacteria bacterium]|nr:class I SAM-dependent methyltransferase [Ignavibacteria bacterium]